MLLDQRLPESDGDAIAARALLAVGLLACGTVVPGAAQWHDRTVGEGRLAAFQTTYPELHALLVGVERAHGVYYGALARGRGKVNESDLFRLMTRRIATGALDVRADADADAGYAVLGARGAEIVRRTHAFHREALAILAAEPPADRARALDEAVDRYLSRPEVALPDVPKDMTILYDHPYTSIVIDVPGAPRKKTPKPKGFIWASHWLQLAAAEPLQLSAQADDRRRSLKVVTDRFHLKLSSGKPPNAFPTELPLAPSIAPELVTIHVRTAAIIDNLNMMLAVCADVLAHPKAEVRAALDEAIAQFTNRRQRVVEEEDWIRMALRHSIFEQGGPALGVMTVSDRNGSGHLQHLGGGRGILPGMK